MCRMVGVVLGLFSDVYTSSRLKVWDQWLNSRIDVNDTAISTDMHGALHIKSYEILWS